MCRWGKRGLQVTFQKVFPVSPRLHKKLETRTRLELTLGYFPCESGRLYNPVTVPLTSGISFFFFICIFVSLLDHQPDFYFYI